MVMLWLKDLIHLQSVRSNVRGRGYLLNLNNKIHLSCNSLLHRSATTLKPVYGFYVVADLFMYVHQSVGVAFKNRMTT